MSEPEESQSTFGHMSLLVSIIPEELLLEKAIEALKVYQLTGGRKPQAEVLALVAKWSVEGMTPAEILARNKEADDIYRVGKNMTNFENKGN